MITEYQGSYIFSRFLHRKIGGNEVLVFNSLSPDPPIKVELTDWEEFTRDPRKDCNPLLFDSLVDLNLLISSRESDTKQLANVRDHFRDGLPSIPKTLYLVLTENCNLACDYCPFSKPRDLDKKSQSMSVGIAQKGLDFWSRSLASSPSGVPTDCSVIFYGGEPLLNLDTLRGSLEYIDVLKSRGALPEDIRLLLDTNGVLLSNQIGKLLKKYEVMVTVGLDAFSVVNDVHRFYPRGQGTYEIVLRALKILQEADVPTYLSMSATLDNLETLDNLAEYLKRYNILGIGVNILRGVDGGVAYEKESADALEKLFWDFQKEGITEFQTTRRFQAFTSNNFHVSNCGGFGEHVVIHPNGEIGNCPWTRGYSLGDLDKDEDYRCVRNNNFYFRRRESLSLYNEDCLKCEAISICGGKCIWDDDLSGGKSESFCNLSKRMLDSLLWKKSKPLEIYGNV